MARLALFFTLALDFFAIRVIAEFTAVIETTLGPVQGEILSTVGKNVEYSSFKGIRYGDSTRKPRRFEAPHSPRPWSDVLRATEKGPDCPQLQKESSDGKYFGDEDCLFLNIFSPVKDLSQSPEKLKAVMFWIHGARFSSGTSDPNIYGPDFLIENDVVVVTINYRVGPLGFLALNNREASPEPYGIGNAALKDQQLALVWVRKNIEKFGGDPEKVTLFGQGAGGSMAHEHALSEMSKGLFSGIISMSGVPMNSWTFVATSESEKMAFEVGRHLGLDTDDKTKLLNVLNDVSAEDLLRAAIDILPPFRPTREDPTISHDGCAFLDKCMIDQYKSGDFSRVPYMLGFMSEEMLAYTGSDETIGKLETQAMKVATDFNITFSVPSLFNHSGDNWKKRMIKETTDLYFIAGCEHTVRYLTENGDEPVYYYKVSSAPSSGSLHKSLLNIDEPGAAHFDDVAYLWWVSGAGMPLDPNDEISITRERMTRMWTNFAKYGNPTPDGTNDPLLNITWPDYGSTSLMLNINAEMSLESFVNENVNAIIDVSAWHLETAKGCDDY